MKKILLVAFTLFLFLCSCSQPQKYPVIDRNNTLPDDIQKQSPEADNFPPILHTDEFYDPIPLPYPVNTVGGEDSPFILPDGNTLYFFFTPDVRVPHNEQLFDNVTGIWVTNKIDNEWTVPERVWLQDAGKLALDGAPSVHGDIMYFASAREGYTGMNIFTAKNIDGKWSDWEFAGERFADELIVGELHLYDNELYYHTDKEGGKGSFDIWMTTKTEEGWSDAVNIETVNTEGLDGYPYISSDGSVMYFTRTYLGTPAIFRSFRVDGNWQEPELIVSQFAGEPTLDDAGNLYFVHHYFENGVMIEADIYAAYKKME